MRTPLTIVILIRNRLKILGEQVESIRQLDALEQVVPAIIIDDNDSPYYTYNFATPLIETFYMPLRVMRGVRPGKSAAINTAVGFATSDFLAFLDDQLNSV
jgi:glycosyltransferase involved in cell wall biosynthesis